ncbi:uncharacterized protein LOC118341928 [Morone saxatilis]|uniref:uncharacterized protein LOC118341928 n=1 Tax=Morone saxatilis TaxID=34816 RepID=UPI0015E1EC3F|nr:uncharacterized protein LOC118341928 [Morone saxatilis]
MFNVVHQGRKYVPTRSSVTDDSPLTVRTVHVNRSRGTLTGTLTDPPEATWPLPGAKMRISKANKGAVVRAVRRHPSPQPPRLESLEAAWSERGHPEGSQERRNGEPEGGGPPRSRKKGFRPPDVRTIFSEKDPRVREESGEGHTFEPGGENTWCDVCCKYIFQQGLTCAGCKYAVTQRVGTDVTGRHPAVHVGQTGPAEQQHTAPWFGCAVMWSLSADTRRINSAHFKPADHTRSDSAE